MKNLFLTAALVLPVFAWAEGAPDAPTNVTIGNLVRAETDHMIRENMRTFGFGVGEITHLREPTTTDNQPVIRMNQDTLYSGMVIDLQTPVTVTLPEIGGRYMSMQVISQDHYLQAMATPGTFELSKDNVGSRFAFLSFRTFADVADPDDIADAHKAQDAIKVTGGGTGPFEAPNWNLDQLALARQAINDLATLGFDTKRAFGSKDQTDPVDHLIGAIAGWGGLPAKAASYHTNAVAENDGKTPFSVTLKDVPVRAFWSLTVYNSEGYMEANDLGVNSYNNYTATPSDDGAFTIHFGGCEDGRVNCIPVTAGWNYALRLYEPEPEILDGSWTFPALEIIN
ncbi:hypothetical protein CSC82_19075 [Rhodobacteraceae bacterium 4F10]|nr:hypothetical protein CSC82_19075 [Rhodobacteraceae bacterium 4F10]